MGENTEEAAQILEQTKEDYLKASMFTIPEKKERSQKELQEEVKKIGT